MSRWWWLLISIGFYEPVVADPLISIGLVPLGSIDLRELVGRLAARDSTRPEANVQSDVRMLLLAAPLNLAEHQVEDVILESPAGGGRRVDVEAGFTVFEVKRDLRSGNVLEEAVKQLGGYVAHRAQAMGQRYVGVLTDGAEWRLYHQTPQGGLEEVGLPHMVSAAEPDVNGLVVWLESVLATQEQVVPTPGTIDERLGAASPSHELDYADLLALYEEHRDDPTVKLKRELWSRLLTTAFGTGFKNEDSLFVNHTLLVMMAEIIAHAVVGFDPASPDLAPATLLAGSQFEQAQIGGVVEEDFFDWVIEVPDGDRIVRALARRLARFAWSKVEHDVMKVLYESVIEARERHRLGEYYTPDWLAEQMVEAVVAEPLKTRVLDPACGSGTFLFHAVRRYLAAAEAAEAPTTDAIVGASSHVIGVDVHPVAVTFARVTYLLAIGMQRLRAADRGPFSVPVYLGDSLQWGQEKNLLTQGALTVTTEGGAQLFGSELRFPDRLVADAGNFDRLVAELARRAGDRPAGSPPPSLQATFRRFAVHPEDQPTIEATFRAMCELHDQGRDHVWGYYVRNLARPTWLAHNRVDALIGNPPWLAYQFMTSDMQRAFKSMCRERGIWAGGKQATHQDLSGLFVARAAELYLRSDGPLAFVMPYAALSRQQFKGFRSGHYTATSEEVHITFGRPWDLNHVRPHPFPVPASVVFGRRSTSSKQLAQEAVKYTGHLPGSNLSWAEAEEHLSIGLGDVVAVGHAHVSPYRERFAQGATILPRVLVTVQDAPAAPLGAGAGRRAVRSLRTKQEKAPWKGLTTLQGIVETQFVRPMHLGATVTPFRPLEPLLGVIPWDGKRLLHGGDPRLDNYDGLAAWWRQAEKLWEKHRSNDSMTLIERLNYHGLLKSQFPIHGQRVVYSKAGNRIASARIADTSAVIDHKLYWAAATSPEEARYLCAILNSATLTARVEPLQSRGAFGPRDFDLYVFHIAIPLYDPNDSAHLELAALGARAEEVAATVVLAEGYGFQKARRLVREALVVDGVAGEIEQAVGDLIAP
jgi:SAM-dependent methyltransferase